MLNIKRIVATSLTLYGLGACGSDGSADPDASVPTSDDASVPDGAASDAAASDGALGAEDAGSDAATSPNDAGTGTPDAAVDPSTLGKFSFFATSQKALFALAQASGAGDRGFGGDLRYGETGDGAGLRGADKICAQIAEQSMPGASAKQWRAFLSTSTVNAKDRIGMGPWYDRRERLIAQNLTNLLQTRPADAPAEIKNDLPNESGTPNHNPDGTGNVDNHDFLTGSDTSGNRYVLGGAGAHCDDWTNSTVESGKKPRVGHSWPRSGGGGGGFGGGGAGGMDNWMSALDEAGCGKGAYTPEEGGGRGVGNCDGRPDDPSCTPAELFGSVGSGGGYGGFYCFALTP